MASICWDLPTSATRLAGLQTAWSPMASARSTKSKRPNPMVDSTLDILRRDAIERRIKGAPGGNRIHWDSKQSADLRGWIMATKEDVFRAQSSTRKFVDSSQAVAGIRAKLSSSALAAGEGQPDNSPWIFCITNGGVDLQGDVIRPDGLRFDPKYIPV